MARFGDGGSRLLMGREQMALSSPRASFGDHLQSVTSAKWQRAPSNPRIQPAESLTICVAGHKMARIAANIAKLPELVRGRHSCGG